MPLAKSWQLFFLGHFEKREGRFEGVWAPHGREGHFEGMGTMGGRGTLRESGHHGREGHFERGSL